MWGQVLGVQWGYSGNSDTQASIHGGLSSGPPELYKSVAAGNVKACPWDHEVSDFLCPEVIWTESFSCAPICILPRKKSPVKISMKSSLSDVYAGVIVSLSLFSPQKHYLKCKH